MIKFIKRLIGCKKPVEKKVLEKVEVKGKMRKKDMEVRVKIGKFKEEEGELVAPVSVEVKRKKKTAKKSKK